MMTFRRATERQYERHGKQELWRTFYPNDRSELLGAGFGTVEILNEDHLPPGASIQPSLPSDGESVTYVCEGALAYEHSNGSAGIILAGEFQHTSGSRGNGQDETNGYRSETNGLLNDCTHVFTIGLHASEPALKPSLTKKRFSLSERRGALRLFASPDGQQGSLQIQQDALMYSAVLAPGRHIVHELSRGRSAWLHVVAGEIVLGDNILSTGDGIGIVDEAVVSLTARQDTEILLLDLG